MTSFVFFLACSATPKKKNITIIKSVCSVLFFLLFRACVLFWRPPFFFFLKLGRENGRRGREREKEVFFFSSSEKSFVKFFRGTPRVLSLFLSLVFSSFLPFYLKRKRERERKTSGGGKGGGGVGRARPLGPVKPGSGSQPMCPRQPAPRQPAPRQPCTPRSWARHRGPRSRR